MTETVTGVRLEDRINIPTSRIITDAGQMIVPCTFARTGAQVYTAGQLQLADRSPNELITIYRDEKDVFDQASLDTFRSSPVTVGHPADADGNKIQVTIENANDLQVGMLEGMPARDEDTLGGNLVITDKAAIETIESGTKGLSAGYLCDLEEVDGKLYQRNIRANHIAIVDKGRGGTACRISDEALDINLEDATEASDEEGVTVEKLQVELTDSMEKSTALEAELDVQKQLVLDSVEACSKLEGTVKELTDSLADAKLAAKEEVVLRCETIENARLIADMRDLGDQSVEAIQRLVVADQMPSMNIEDESPEYVSAMFKILTDAAKGDTPMGKLLRANDVNDQVTVDATVDVVGDARQRMIDRHKGVK